MAKIVLRQEAVNDLSDIWNYTTFEWSKQQAEKYLKEIETSCQEIGTIPSLGKTYKRIGSKILGYKSGRHIIFYHIISEDEIEVIRVLHERMDLKRRLFE